MKRPRLAAAIAALSTAAAVTGCGLDHSNATAADATKPEIRAVGAESQYADLIRQIGGPYVSVTAIMANPAVDPHEYEANPKDAIAVAEANLVVQNGLGYDEFMNKLEQASPNAKRIVLDAGEALGYQANTANPHIWYQLNTMPRLATMVARDLGKLDPSHAAYFDARARAFIQSLKPWDEAVARLKRTFHGRGAAVTEPVSDYLLQEAGLDVKTPWAFQAAIMNGTDPSPQDVALQTALFTHHEVGVFCYNKQVVTNVTRMFLNLAAREHIPTVAVYETEPNGLTYQQWMLEETNAIYNALAHGTSLEAIS
ncbi:metal ABC transporter solute-binding protein, Zn/Mn family [Alicyclobacillus vulcanalis]|uniref:Zinc/manganese transport system substrate-binding protein n=1 Tax=Alicyclobacillus vulcanalis TaxID=252246 RepID=A0A1N7JLA8_9BACL|nr:zinc ABC transporter substrate-binding protein [Alicyclobacillus vulcanalis]SIS50034.1 zinc/manganese transport system substrate-binding protein [Alicyclobacillus vulcanalis]